MLKVVHGENETNKHAPAAVGGSLLDELVRDGARQMLAAALLAEVAAYVEAFADQVGGAGHRLVVRNGYHAEREVATAAGVVPVRAPRVNDKRIDAETGGRKRFSSAILPAWARKSPQVAEVLPLLYLHGLSSSDFGPALEQFLGSSAGLSAATITRLTAQWQDDAAAFNNRSLKGTDYVYCWVDGIHLKVRLEQDKACLLVMIGVRADGKKELIAVSDGFGESSESWADLLRDCKRRGMRAPVLAVGDGALGSGRRCARSSPTPRSRGVGSTSRPTCSPRSARSGICDCVQHRCLEGSEQGTSLNSRHHPEQPIDGWRPPASEVAALVNAWKHRYITWPASRYGRRLRSPRSPFATPGGANTWRYPAPGWDTSISRSVSREWNATAICVIGTLR